MIVKSAILMAYYMHMHLKTCFMQTLNDYLNALMFALMSIAHDTPEALVDNMPD